MARRMGVEWEERGAWGSFRTPICSAKTRGLASPRQGGLRREHRPHQGFVSCVQARGSNRGVRLGMFCALG